MRIKPNSGQICMIILYVIMDITFICCCTVVAIIQLRNFTTASIIGMFLFICFYCLFTAFLLLLIYNCGKSYHYEKIGCTISFLCYSRTYSWENLHTKKYEKNMLIASTDPYWGASDGLVFSVDSYQRSKRLAPVAYLDLFSPFSSFYIVFPSETLEGKPIPRNKYQFPVADRDEFLGLMEEWGVEIEGLE